MRRTLVLHVIAGHEAICRLHSKLFQIQKHRLLRRPRNDARFAIILRAAQYKSERTSVRRKERSHEELMPGS